MAKTITTKELFGKKKSNVTTEELFPQSKKEGVISTEQISAMQDSVDFSKMSKFQKVLDIISRPGAGVKSVIAEQQKSAITPKGILPSFEETKAQMEQQPTLQERNKAFMRGFTGQERFTGNELWKNRGVEGIPFLGFATDIATDPLMYGGYSAITKGIGKAVSGTTKGLQKIPAFAKTTAKVSEWAQPATSRLRELFVNKSGIKTLDEFINKHLLKRQYITGKEIKYATKVRNVIQNISRKTGQSVDDIEKQIVNLIEQPHIIPRGVTTEAKALANTLGTHFSNMLTAELKAGVPITALAGGSRNILYFPRFPSKEAMRYLKQAKIGNARVWNPRLANALKRHTADFTLQEFNDFIKFHGYPSLGGKSIEQFFLQKPSIAVALRGIRSAKAITSNEFLDDVVKWGISEGKAYAQKAPSWYQELPSSITRLKPNLKGLRFDPEITSEVTRVFPKYLNTQELGTFRKGFDALQNLWKRWTLAPFPKYHLRNMVGNVWNNYLAGVGPSAYPKAQAIQMYRKYKGRSYKAKGIFDKTGAALERTSLLNLRMMGISPQQADDIILQGEKLQVLGRGWFGGDIETSVEQQIKQGFIKQPLKTKIKKLSPISSENIVLEKGMAFGTTIENNARLAHFIDKLSKGDDAMSAATSVKKFLFDYQDMTAFEREVMKRFMPFYTWTRKNVPLQLEMIWKQPEKFMGLSPLVRNRDPQDLLRLKYAMPQLYERMPVELKRDAETITYVPLEGLIPAGDLAKMVRPQEILYELLSPYLRAPLEIAFNKSLYFESEIEKYDNETQELLRKDIPVKLKYHLTTILPQARLVNEINKIIKKQFRREKLTPAEQVFSQTLSSIYKINLVDLKQRAIYTLEGKVRDLENGMYRAKLHQRGPETERIKKTYLKIKEEYQKVRGF